MAARSAKKRRLARTPELLNAKIIELERTVALKAVEQSQAAQQMFELQQNNATWEHEATREKLRWEAVTMNLIEEREVHSVALKGK
jgi:hypothetical protein